MRASMVGLLLLLGTGSVVRAQDDETPRPQGNWFTRIFHKKPAAKPAEKKEKKLDDLPPALAPSPVLQSPGAQRSLAQTVLMRREEACLRFQEIAAQTGDDDLLRKADLLNQRVWEAYLRKMGSMPGTRGNLTPEEMVLESKLRPGTNGARPATEGPRSGAQASRRRTPGEE